MDGTPNAAIGYQALQTNVSGTNNVAIGDNALNLATGSQNTAIGSGAGATATTGSNNVLIGYSTDLTTFGTSSAETDSNRVFIGNTSSTVTCIGGIGGITTGTADAIAVLIDSNGQLGTLVSSKKFKKNIVPVDQETAEKLAMLNIVTFSYIDDETNSVQYGAIAEEVLQIFPRVGCV